MQIAEIDYETYEQPILSGQVPHDEVNRMFKDNPGFAAWYRQRARDRRLAREMPAGNDNWQ